MHRHHSFAPSIYTTPVFHMLIREDFALNHTLIEIMDVKQIMKFILLMFLIFGSFYVRCPPRSSIFTKFLKTVFIEL